MELLAGHLAYDRIFNAERLLLKHQRGRLELIQQLFTEANFSFTSARRCMLLVYCGASDNDRLLRCLVQEQHDLVLKVEVQGNVLGQL